MGILKDETTRGTGWVRFTNKAKGTPAYVRLRHVRLIYHNVAAEATHVEVDHEHVHFTLEVQESVDAAWRIVKDEIEAMTEEEY